ncbi:polar localization protein TipN [Caulobacter sp. KR2-114]|uniref:polar localization protein TipN n=1 Tax=Caulobacter sp. KR2-114 TaxID=3400912 RepID=UPI003C0EE26F
MSSSKRTPLVFPSIKVGAVPTPERSAPEPAPDAAPPAAAEPSAPPPPASEGPVLRPAQPLDAPSPPEPTLAAPPAAEPVRTEPAPAEPALRMQPPAPAAAQSVARTTDAPAQALFPARTDLPASALPDLRAPKAPPVRGPYIAATVASLLWAGGLAAFVVGYQSRLGPLDNEAFGLAVLAALAVAPLGFIWAAAFAVRQALLLAGEVRRAKQLTDVMIGPAAVAANEAGSVVEALRLQVDAASRMADEASQRLSALREALARETAQLSDAAGNAHRTAVALTDGLSKERGQMQTLAVTLDARAAAVADAINRQVDMVAQATDLAETQLREAEASLAGRAADLAAAAMEATDASRTAGDDLARQIARLETAGLGVGDQLRALEDGLTHQRASLVTVAHALRADQEDFAALAESRTAQLSTFIAGASRDVAALNEVTTIGAQALSDLIEAAASKFRELSEHARHERDLFSDSAVGSLNALSEAGAKERQALEAQMHAAVEALSHAASEAREAADIHAEAARARVEQLNEAAFSAGQKADQVFEARLSEARGLIEQSARLIEEAGQRTSKRLETGVTDARTAIETLETVLNQVGARASQMPAEAEKQAEQIRAALATGLDELLATARRASEETQAIDAAFQDRVKRNYEMLSEAVQLMGVVAQGGQGAEGLRRAPAGRPARISSLHPHEPTAGTAAPPPPAVEAPAAAEVVPPATPPAAAPTAPEPAGRPRLRLTPTATDEEFKAVFQGAAGGASPPTTAAEGWSWKELLTSIDGDAAGQDAELGRSLFREVEGMGIDPTALLSRGRVEEIAAVVQTNDPVGAREVVRTLAPAAVRRLSRRLISDTPFRANAQTFVERYAAIIAEAMRRDHQGFQAAALLASDAGRAYLLLDAAAGD